jgi:hypothetical protein
LVVNLRGTPVDDDQVAALQRARPQLSITRS